MKLALTLSLLPLYTSAVAASKSFSFFSHDQQTLGGDDLSVPGDNPLDFCADPADYILIIDNVDLDPNPPQK